MRHSNNSLLSSLSDESRTRCVWKSKDYLVDITLHYITLYTWFSVADAYKSVEKTGIQLQNNCLHTSAFVKRVTRKLGSLFSLFWFLIFHVTKYTLHSCFTSKTRSLVKLYEEPAGILHSKNMYEACCSWNMYIDAPSWSYQLDVKLTRKFAFRFN